MKNTIYVSKTTANISENEDFTTCYASVSEALDSIPQDNQIPVIIKITPGVYHEKITINKPYVALVGTGASNEDTVLSYDDYALFIMEDGCKRGTFRSYSVFIDTHDVTLRNLTIENASGDSLTHGQAIALYADGDRLLVDSCRLLGHQDTLFTGPLPPKEVEPGGFIGPKQFAPRINGRQYYKNCYICGDIDFIFGSATAFFEACTIESLRRTWGDSDTDAANIQPSDAAIPPFSGNKKEPGEPDSFTEVQGYITAASTPENQEYGYVFSKCNIISHDCPKASVYLGRPWREFAKTVFLECSIGPHIHPHGFHDWNKPAARDTVFYAGYRNYPSQTSDERISEVCTNCKPFFSQADFVVELDATEATHFSREAVLAGDDGWY